MFTERRVVDNRVLLLGLDNSRLAKSPRTRSNNRMQATAGGLGGSIGRDGRATAAPDAERYAEKERGGRGRTASTQVLEG